MAEDICVSKSCGHAYDRTATNFPFTIDYEKRMNSGSTTFDFEVRVQAQHGSALFMALMLGECIVSLDAHSSAASYVPHIDQGLCRKASELCHGL